MEKSGYVKDPVCGNQVDPQQYPIVYLEIPYAFCSRQCLELFQAHPHLYVGQPGFKAPRQEGKEILKRRKLRLAYALSAGQAVELAEALSAFPGIKKVVSEGDTLTIIYDLLLVTTGQIEEKLAEIGVKLGNGWADRLQLAFLHYEEELEASSLEINDRNSYG